MDTFIADRLDILAAALHALAEALPPEAARAALANLHRHIVELPRVGADADAARAAELAALVQALASASS